MIEFIQKLFIGHHHKWKIIEQYQIWGNAKNKPEAIRKVLQCEICGKLKKFDI